jgi:hypothetical protein
VDFEHLCRVTREQRVRIANLRAADHGDDDDAAMLTVEQSLYDSRLVDLARMLDVVLPLRASGGGGLDADHRSMLEDHLAERGADLRPS